ncbi:hypothetical protein BJ912DRAFT_1039766 [Pholiota molesta]|nr:hypothetical protein BJ912DRAFT_1039766 [Pholiota molesta]
MEISDWHGFEDPCGFWPRVWRPRAPPSNEGCGPAILSTLHAPGDDARRVGTTHRGMDDTLTTNNNATTPDDEKWWVGEQREDPGAGDPIADPSNVQAMVGHVVINIHHPKPRFPSSVQPRLPIPHHYPRTPGDTDAHADDMTCCGKFKERVWQCRAAIQPSTYTTRLQLQSLRPPKPAGPATQTRQNPYPFARVAGCVGIGAQKWCQKKI